MPVLRLWKAYEIGELEQDLGFTLPFESTQGIEDQTGALVTKANAFQNANLQLTFQATFYRQEFEELKKLEEATECEGRGIREVRDKMEWLQNKELMFSVHARKYSMASDLISRHFAFVAKEDQEVAQGPGVEEYCNHLLDGHYEWVDDDH